MKNKSTIGIIVVAVIIILALAAGGYYYWQKKDSKTTTTNTTTKTTTTDTEETLPVKDAEAPEDALERVKKYDGKEYKITDDSGKIEGRAQIIIDESEEYMKVKVGYFIKINDTFPKSSVMGIGSDYNLFGNLQQADQSRNGDGTGAISSILCEQAFWPDLEEMVLGDSYEQTKKYVDCTWGDTSLLNRDTDLFYHQLSRFNQPKDFTLNFVTQLDKLEIYNMDGLWFEDTLEDGSTYYNYDDETVVKEGEIVGNYNLIYQ